MKLTGLVRLNLISVLFVAFVSLLFTQTSAQAVPVAGLTTTDRLVFFDSNSPGVVAAVVSITGLQAGEHVLAVDFRPLTGQVYALGSSNRIYVVNPVNGLATQVGSGPFTAVLNGFEFGFDFDPVTDRLRVVSNTGQNMRIDPNTGAVVSVDTGLSFAAGEAGAGTIPDITGVAYTNNFKGAASTTLFAIDWRRGQLERIGSADGSPISPNTGQVFSVGSLGTGFQITEMVGFDIAANTGTAYAALRSADALSGSFFYTINLSTGAATQQGLIGGGEFIRDITVMDRAVDLFAVTASNKLLRFNSGTPGVIISSVNISLLSPSEHVIGLDYIYHTLYLISDASRVYILDPVTGATHHQGQFNHDPLIGTDFGVTANPQGYLQVVSDADQNLLVNPYVAVGAAPRTVLAYAAGDAHAGANPNVVGAAFTQEEPAAATMFDIDSNLDILVRQGAADGNPLSFESGQLSTIGPLGVNTTGMVGFDIEQTPIFCNCNYNLLRTGPAFASLTAPGDAVSKLYTIDLKTGAATLQGTIGGGELVRHITTVQVIGLFAFSQNGFFGNEDGGSIPVTVTRSGDTNVAASVDYETADQSAKQASDYTYTSGTLYFGLGETSKSISIPITHDGLVNESSSGYGEIFSVRLSNPTANFGLAPSQSGGFQGPGTTDVRIIDNDGTSGPTNPADDADFFVRQHYRDFLSRDADAAGLAFWKGEINGCGSDAACAERKRVAVSAAFFLSVEFQNTGFLVHRLYKTSFNRTPLYKEFMQGAQKIGRGIVVGESGWEAKLENSKQAFLNEWANCKAFKDAFDGKTNAQYVGALLANAELVTIDPYRQNLVNDLDNHVRTRAQVLRFIAEDSAVIKAEFNHAFVLMQYFGYLRRNPNDAPDVDFSGYNFWLAKLNQFNGNYVAAEMVKAFLTSGEYRQRFGP